jgi:phage shock protein A
MKMTEEKTTSETENVIKHNQAEIMAENLQLKATVDKLVKQIEELTSEFDAARKQLESATRSKKIDRILQVSDLGMQYLTEKSLSELDEIEELYKHVKTHRFKSTGDTGKYASEYDQVLYKLNNSFKFDPK